VTISDRDAAILRSRGRRVTSVDESVRRLIADMFTTMRAARGVGLAAPQVGVPLRVLIAGLGKIRLALVNPLIRRRRGIQVGPEGCLSIPGIYGDVRRSLHVVVEGQDPRGRRVVARGTGLLARVLQHEIDHLNGVLFIDRIVGKGLRMLRLRPRRARGRIGIVPEVVASGPSPRH